jgi:hypothetical protein
VVDHNHPTGTTGTMRIRDTGSTVEFWINSGDAFTFIHELPWGYTINGSTNNSREFDYRAGSGWQKLGGWSVTSDQSVTFHLGSTGLSAFGGPYDYTVDIDRASAPAKPTITAINNIVATSMEVIFKDGANNGASIDSRQIGYGTNSTNPTDFVSSDGSTTVGGLTPGTTYNFWARTHNSKGYSPWSTKATRTTLKTPDPPNPPVLSDATQTSFFASFTDNSDGGSPILERQLRYSTVNDPTLATPVTYTGVTEVTGLDPATTYYVWARVRNSVGWSAYSAARTIRTIAGVFVKVGAEWKEAIPYVKDGGVWKLAEAWGRVAGVWKKTT